MIKIIGDVEQLSQEFSFQLTRSSLKRSPQRNPKTSDIKLEFSFHVLIIFLVNFKV